MSSSTITPSSPLGGSCFCGAIKYELSAPPVLRAYCHCTQCQRLTGMSFFPLCRHDPSKPFWAQVAHSFILHTFPPPPSHGSTTIRSTSLSTHSGPGRTALAAARVVSQLLRSTRKQIESACGGRTLLGTSLDVFCAGMKCDLPPISITGHGCWI